jgi:hypothetical protein
MSNEGGFDLNNLLQQAQAMQQQVAEAQEEQARQIVTGSAGGGKVTVEATGDGEYRKVVIAPDVVDPDDVEMLEELVLAAVRDAANQLADLQASAFGNIEMPGLGGLGGLLGGQ